MIRMPKLSSRQILIVLHDPVATAAAVIFTFYSRFEGNILQAKLTCLEIFTPIFVIYAGVVTRQPCSPLPQQDLELWLCRRK